METKLIFKKLDGIRYYSNTIIDGYRLWQSNTHPNYKHFTKLK